MKPNTTKFHSCTITANINILRKQRKIKANDLGKINLKTRNGVISFTRDEISSKEK